MKPDSPSSENLERLTGTIEHITFHNEENGFCVLRAKVKGHRDLVTVLGEAATIAPGERIECQGCWVNDKKHGRQFITRQLKIIPPVSLEGIEKYLASGMVKGVGAHLAKQLVNTFGDAVFDVIENSPKRLAKLKGVGEQRKKMITASWAEQKSIRDIMVFLQSNGIGAARAARIHKIYGDKAIERIRANPYSLSLDVQGIGFKTADELAQKLGIAKDSILRAQAGVRHALQELCDHGDCAAAYNHLVNASASLLEIPEPLTKEALDKEIEAKNLILENIDDIPCVFPVSLYQAECSAAKHLLRIHANDPPWGEIDTAHSIPWVEKKTGMPLSDSQKLALEAVLNHKLSIITGGPGVGKTTIVNSILKILRSKKLFVSLCAPTGRAAKKLTETTGLPAKTIHRLLEYDPKAFMFKRDEDNPLPVDVIIVDESSMLDIVLLNKLLKAIPDRAALIFVGDVDQLPSVRAGAVLMDMIRSSVIKTVKLTEIFRQAADSNIIVNAHRINQGEMPLPNQSKSGDFYSIYVETPEEMYDQLVSLVTERLPQYYQCNPVTDIQILTPMNRGGLGSTALNITLQQNLNGLSEPKVTRYGVTLAPGDKVIQTVNNYDKEVFNGDIGFVSRIDPDDNSVKVSFDNRTVDYAFNELDEISLAYAISIHKSQGSEFPIVIILLSTQHYRLLARNLLYTGVTRGKQLVILLGQKKAVGLAVKNNRENKRLTKLSERLITALGVK